MHYFKKKVALKKLGISLKILNLLHLNNMRPL